MSTFTTPLNLMNFLGGVDVRQIARSLSGSLAQDQQFCPKDFDVDHDTGFFPPEPLPKLPSAFSIWEDALIEAQETLSLGEDESDEAKAKRPAGSQWREQIRSVRLNFHAFCVIVILINQFLVKVACLRHCRLAGQYPSITKSTSRVSLHSTLLRPLHTSRRLTRRHSYS